MARCSTKWTSDEFRGHARRAGGVREPLIHGGQDSPVIRRDGKVQCIGGPKSERELIGQPRGGGKLRALHRQDAKRPFDQLPVCGQSLRTSGFVNRTRSELDG